MSIIPYAIISIVRKPISFADIDSLFQPFTTSGFSMSKPDVWKPDEETTLFTCTRRTEKNSRYYSSRIRKDTFKFSVGLQHLDNAYLNYWDLGVDQNDFGAYHKIRWDIAQDCALTYLEIIRRLIVLFPPIVSFYGTGQEQKFPDDDPIIKLTTVYPINYYSDLFITDNNIRLDKLEVGDYDVLERIGDGFLFVPRIYYLYMGVTEHLDELAEKIGLR
ncbi:MAG TPA: hypothetical protein PK299_10600 [Anaerolineales bacterium]|nr:hypothetical protein [Anaerolineales bacterium]